MVVVRAQSDDEDVSVVRAVVGRDVSDGGIDRRHAFLAISLYWSRTEVASLRPKRMSSFEKPNVNESFWSISVTSTSSATESDSRLASSNPANPAPRITTCFFTREDLTPSGPSVGVG